MVMKSLRGQISPQNKKLKGNMTGIRTQSDIAENNFDSLSYIKNKGYEVIKVDHLKWNWRTKQYEPAKFNMYVTRGTFTQPDINEEAMRSPLNILEGIFIYAVSYPAVLKNWVASGIIPLIEKGCLSVPFTAWRNASLSSGVDIQGYASGRLQIRFYISGQYDYTLVYNTAKEEFESGYYSSCREVLTAKYPDPNVNKKVLPQIEMDKNPTEDMEIATKEYADRKNAFTITLDGTSADKALVEVKEAFNKGKELILRTQHSIGGAVLYSYYYLASVTPSSFVFEAVPVIASPEDSDTFISSFAYELARSDGTWSRIKQSVDLDNKMSDTSKNPVRNSVIKKYVDSKIPTSAGNRVLSYSIVLAASAWSNNTQSVTVDGVTADCDIWAFTPDGITCTAQADNSLTFTAASTPAANKTVEVMVII